MKKFILALTMCLIGCGSSQQVVKKPTLIPTTEVISSNDILVGKDNWSFSIPNDFKQLPARSHIDFIYVNSKMTLAFLSEPNTLVLNIDDYTKSFAVSLSEVSDNVNILDVRDAVLDGSPAKILLIQDNTVAAIHFIVVDAKMAYHFDCSGEFGKMGEIASACFDIAKSFKRK